MAELSFLGTSQSLIKLMSTESMMPSSPLMLCCPLLLLPCLCLRWAKYWSFSISPSNEYSGFISFRIDWSDLLAVQGIHILNGTGHTPFSLPACLHSNRPCIFYTLFPSVIPTHPPRPPEIASEKEDRNILQNVCYLLASGRSLLSSPGSRSQSCKRTSVPSSPVALQYTDTSSPLLHLSGLFISQTIFRSGPSAVVARMISIPGWIWPG